MSSLLRPFPLLLLLLALPFSCRSDDDDATKDPTFKKPKRIDTNVDTDFKLPPFGPINSGNLSLYQKAISGTYEERLSLFEDERVKEGDFWLQHALSKIENDENVWRDLKSDAARKKFVIAAASLSGITKQQFVLPEESDKATLPYVCRHYSRHLFHNTRNDDYDVESIPCTKSLYEIKRQPQKYRMPIQEVWVEYSSEHEKKILQESYYQRNNLKRVSHAINAVFLGGDNLDPNRWIFVEPQGPTIISSDNPGSYVEGDEFHISPKHMLPIDESLPGGYKSDNCSSRDGSRCYDFVNANISFAFGKDKRLQRGAPTWTHLFDKMIANENPSEQLNTVFWYAFSNPELATAIVARLKTNPNRSDVWSGAVGKRLLNYLESEKAHTELVDLQNALSTKGKERVLTASLFHKMFGLIDGQSVPDAIMLTVLSEENVSIFHSPHSYFDFKKNRPEQLEIANDELILTAFVLRVFESLATSKLKSLQVALENNLYFKKKLEAMKSEPSLPKFYSQEKVAWQVAHEHCQKEGRQLRSYDNVVIYFEDLKKDIKDCIWTSDAVNKDPASAYAMSVEAITNDKGRIASGQKTYKRHLKQCRALCF